MGHFSNFEFGGKFLLVFVVLLNVKNSSVHIHKLINSGAMSVYSSTFTGPGAASGLTVINCTLYMSQSSMSSYGSNGSPAINSNRAVTVEDSAFTSNSAGEYLTTILLIIYF